MTTTTTVTSTTAIPILGNVCPKNYWDISISSKFFNSNENQFASRIFFILACDSSSDCGDKAFCTFDGGNDGNCESCSSLGNKKCSDFGFVDDTDKDECKLECEG